MAGGAEAAVDAAAGDASESIVGVRVRTHPALCRGWGNCHRWAPEVYPLDAEGLIDVHLLEVPPSHALDAWRGASVCPERAITVIGPPERHWLERSPTIARPAAPAAPTNRSVP